MFTGGLFHWEVSIDDGTDSNMLMHGIENPYRSPQAADVRSDLKSN